VERITVAFELWVVVCDGASLGCGGEVMLAAMEVKKVESSELVVVVGQICSKGAARLLFLGVIPRWRCVRCRFRWSKDGHSHLHRWLMFLPTGDRWN
jgi:hypothetical protein